jgi:hypothetical protein
MNLNFWNHKLTLNFLFNSLNNSYSLSIDATGHRVFYTFRICCGTFIWVIENQQFPSERVDLYGFYQTVPAKAVKN